MPLPPTPHHRSKVLALAAVLADAALLPRLQRAVRDQPAAFGSEQFAALPLLSAMCAAVEALQKLACAIALPPDGNWQVALVARTLVGPGAAALAATRSCAPAQHVCGTAATMQAALAHYTALVGHYSGGGAAALSALTSEVVAPTALAEFLRLTYGILLESWGTPPRERVGTGHERQQGKGWQG